MRQKHRTLENLQYWYKTSQHVELLHNLPDKWDRQIKLSDGFRMPYQNNILYYIGKEYREQFGNDLKIYKHLHLFSGKILNEREKHEYPAIYIHTVINQFTWSWQIEFNVYGLRGENNRFEIKPPHKMILNEYNITNFIWQYVHTKIFYPENTRFGRLQREYMIQKNQLPGLLRYLRQKETPTYFNDPDIVRYFERKFNIIPHHDNMITDWQEFYKLCRNYVNIHGRPEETKEVMEFRMPDLSYFDGDILEAESLFWDEVDQYPENAILV